MDLFSCRLLATLPGKDASALMNSDKVSSHLARMVELHLLQNRLKL